MKRIEVDDPVAVLEKTALKVKKLYYEQRRDFNLRFTGVDLPDNVENHKTMWDGGTNRDGKRFKSVWVKIVQFAQKNNIDPEVLVESVFGCHEHGTPPTPQQISGPYGLECVSRYKAVSEERLKLQYRVEKQLAEQTFFEVGLRHPEMGGLKKWRRVITSSLVELSGLFRYCMACNLGQADLAEALYARAMQEYSRSPAAWKKIMGDDLPQEFMRVAELRRQLIS
jgi:hypothetical protein